MPKTGSTTLKSVCLNHLDLSRVFVASEEIYDHCGKSWRDYEDQVRWTYAYETFRDLSDEEARSYDAFVGHTWFGVHEPIDRDFKYVTFIRHPVKRFVSLYNYFFDKRGHWLCKEIRNQSLSFRDFLAAEELSSPWENQYTKYISGDLDTDSSSVEKAIQNIEQHFLLVGLTSHFDEDLLRLANLLGWPPPFYQKKNTSQKHVAVRDLDINIIRQILERNTFHMALYQWVKSHRAESARLQTEFFQKLNWLYGTRIAKPLRRLL
jgi:hypothetical protein